MTSIRFRTFAASLFVGAAGSFVVDALAGDYLVRFPENYAKGVHYATVNRGSIREEIFTSRTAIDAVKNGEPIPSGTVITLVGHRDD